MFGDSALDRRTLLRGAATVAGGTLLGVTATALPASALPATGFTAPLVHTRAQWNARPPKTTATVLDRAPDHIVVHHTASANTDDFSVEAAYALSRSIQNFHMDSNGWDDTGQQLTISRGGHLMEGRNRSLEAITSGRHVVGAQTAGHNDHTIGIENEGLYMTEEPTPALWNTLVETCAWLCDVYDLDPAQAIVGHRDYNATACPGDRLYARLPELRSQVAVLLGGSPLRTTSAPAPSPHPGPRFRFDHGPAIGPGERTR